MSDLCTCNASHAATRLHRPTCATLSIPVMQGKSVSRLSVLHFWAQAVRFAWPIVFMRVVYNSTLTLLLPINSECLGYACQIYGDPSRMSAAGRLLPVLIGPFLIHSCTCTVGTGNDNFNSITPTFSAQSCRVYGAGPRRRMTSAKYVEGHVPSTCPHDSTTGFNPTVVTLSYSR